MTYYINRLVLPFASLTSIIGFILFTVIIIQLMSGFFLAWYFVPEPGLVVDYREEMFDDVRFG
jgi:quinol-cytochrome oxidoreductase complex cytochrome b subunit